MGLRRPIGRAIQILGRAIGIHRRTVPIRVLLMRPRRLRFRLRLVLRRTVRMRSGIARAVRLLRPATPRHRDDRYCREHHQTELDLLPHFLAAKSLCLSQLHLLLRVIRIVVRRSRQILQRLEIREHIVILKNRQVLHHLRIRFHRIAPG